MSKHKVLVTGCAGYVGSVLCQHLLVNAFEVYGVDSFIYANEPAIFGLLGHENFHLFLQDVRDVPALRPILAKVDMVIPLAGVVGAPACNKNPLFAHQVNHHAVRDLVAKLSPGQRVVYPNTNSGYGQTEGNEYITEKSPMRPISLYGATKVAAEKVVLDHPMGVALRLATVFGPSPRMRFDLMVNDFTAALATTGILEVFDPAYKRNFVHVRDVSRVFLRMLLDHRLNGAFNVGLPDANMSKLELAYFVAGTLNLYPMDAVSVGVGNDPDKRNYLVSNEKLLATGFCFAHDLQHGVQDVAQMARMVSPPRLRSMRNA